MNALARLVSIISNSTEPVYVMTLKVRASYFFAGPIFTIGVLPHQCCPRKTQFLCFQNMTSER